VKYLDDTQRVSIQHAANQKTTAGNSKGGDHGDKYRAR
jgi:hypothetical protein